jgi:hypothetical protein
VVEGPDGLLSHWSLPSVAGQQDFYQRKVQPLFGGAVKRVFVVISDAMRFEVAQELVQYTNRKSRFKASIDTMLGVLPSYTALGMAALLPHKTLAYKEGANLDVLADARLVATLDLPEPEVMLAVEVMEVASNRLDELGLSWPRAAAKLADRHN